MTNSDYYHNMFVKFVRKHKSSLNIRSLKMCKSLFLVAAVSLFLLNTEAFMIVRVKAVKCINFVPEVGTIEKCYVKAISRNLTSLNIEGTLFEPRGPPIYVIIIYPRCRRSY